MTTLAERLSSYATSLHHRDLPSEVAHQAKRFIIDSIGCAIGGYTSEPSKIARDLAASVTSSPPATILGSGQATSPDLAAFANGIMIRYLDYNDGYSSKEVGHPTDNLAAVLPLAEISHASGRRVIAAMVAAYETFCRFADALDVKARGFDYVTVGAISATIGAARALSLSPEKTVEALNLAITSNLALYQTRIGNVSMWKGCAHANTSRNAVFATMLAARGLTGPSPVFEGEGGYFKAVTGGPLELEPFGGSGQPFKIMEGSLKRFPLGLFSQAVVEAALAVRQQIPDPREIAEVKIQTLSTAVKIMAGDPEKWRPANRETADHSMPYTAAVALMYGAVNQRHFDDEFLHNKELLDLVSRIKCEPSDEADRRAPDAMLCQLEASTTSGERFSSQVDHFRGHFKNPMTDQEVEEKFRSLVQGLVAPSQAEALLHRLWRLEEVADIGEVIRLTRV